VKFSYLLGNLEFW